MSRNTALALLVALGGLEGGLWALPAPAQKRLDRAQAQTRQWQQERIRAWTCSLRAQQALATDRPAHWQRAQQLCESSAAG